MKVKVFETVMVDEIELPPLSEIKESLEENVFNDEVVNKVMEELDTENYKDAQYVAPYANVDGVDKVLLLVMLTEVMVGWKEYEDTLFGELELYLDKDNKLLEAFFTEYGD